MNQCLREQGLLSACRNNYFQMNSCILAGSIQTTPKVSPGDSEAKPLLFTFVPAVRRLPTHIQLADTSKFLVKIPEEPGDKSPEAVNRFDSSDHMTFSCGSQQERGQGTLAYPSELTGRNSQGKGFETQEPQGMQQSDLFKAEYVFIVDSEGEEEATDKKGEQSPPGGTGAIADRPKSLAISSSLTSDVVRPKVRGVVLKSSSYPEASHGMAPQQKRGQALDEPAKTESISKACTIDPPVEFCFPAQLRQQTEELCATIDKVLQDSLSLHSSDSPLKSPQTLLGSETIKAPTILPRAAGRETKYANLSSSSSTVSESQLTKPGVIRPVPIKSKLLLTKEEDVYEPNPFSKYLEDDSSLFSEQDVAIPHKPVSLHPLYQTKLYPPAKSLLHPQTLSHSDCLTPGPFSHLSSFSLRDEQENSPTFLSQNTYTKLGHPMVAIPEHETLDSKE
ncbi:muscular LMNA-interacting protein isoform X14 [Nannospalax galili]|uniref:muscular LMNA-interacting protein isoform X14 n=1 Tax=Nannospalax galili TaxID=1026970 RepID=UPI00111C3109|nr:muscular LMNA-interacting protein isoform X14 [Nannospalax galili]